MNHHKAQEKGRARLLKDYHLRVGQNVKDTQKPSNEKSQGERFDETEVGDGTTVMLVDLSRSPDSAEQSKPEAVVTLLGLQDNAHRLVAWDVFGFVQTPGNVMLLSTWRDDCC